MQCKRKVLKRNVVPSLNLPGLNKEKLEKNKKRCHRIQMRQTRKAAANKKQDANKIQKQDEHEIDSPESHEFIVQVREDIETEQTLIEDVNNVSQTIDNIVPSHDMEPFISCGLSLKFEVCIQKATNLTASEEFLSTIFPHFTM